MKNENEICITFYISMRLLNFQNYTIAV